MAKKNTIPVHKPANKREFEQLNNELASRRFIAIDALKPGLVRSLTLGDKDPSMGGAQDLAACLGAGVWSNGPLSKVAWSFDNRETNAVEHVNGADGKPLGLGYVKWGPGDNTPSVIPPLAMSSPYTSAPLTYIADLISGLGPALMYCLPDGKMVEFKDAGQWLTGAERNEWQRVWLGNDEEDELGIKTHVLGVKEFLENNNLDLHLSQCQQDNVMLNIYFPTVGFSTWGTRGKWAPKISRLSMLPAHSTRLSRMNETRHIPAVYFSDSLRTKGFTNSANDTEDRKFQMYPAAMPQELLHELRYIVSSHQRGRIKDRPMWVCCPTYYPSLNKPYYPQPAWWSVFTSKAFDFSSTILYDKAKQRENRTSWGKILYISLDYLNDVFGTLGIAGDKEKQDEFINELDKNVEEFLQHRENHGKMMRQFMWQGQDGKDHHNVEIVDIAESTKDEASAGKEELELSTSPIFLALQVDPRLVGVPMVHSSNGGTALREMHLLKQQQLGVHQRMYLNLLTAILNFNGWDCGGKAKWVIKQQTLTTLDASKTGLIDTLSSQGA